MTDIIYPGATYGYVEARAELDAKADLKVLSAPASPTDHCGKYRACMRIQDMLDTFNHQPGVWRAV